MPQCYHLDLQHLIGKRWVVPILQEINATNTGFNHIHKRLKKVTPKVLAERLKELEHYKLITKKVMSESVSRTEYGITLQGKDFLKIISQLQQCTRENNPETPGCTATNCSDCRHY